MTRFFAIALISGTILSPIGLGVSSAAAQEQVTPAPDPVVRVPPVPGSATETFDEFSVGNLMKIVELLRFTAGGIVQLFGSVQDQSQALDLIREAQTGPKTFPLLNGPIEVEDRDGGAAPILMARSAVDGIETGLPADVIGALGYLRNLYSLDKAFALSHDESVSKRIIAHAAASGAVAASVADTSYRRANTSMNRLGGYITALESSPDLKTSVDINTRVMIEVAQQLNESLRVQAAVTSVAATHLMIMGGESGAESWVDGLKDFNR